ncbi:hypothetical protein SNE40_023028 [Patella caerulea]|uniref:Uncharacterized protein n=1 Tax=Patella caerulea TaxID=87958 RepID=A0AAN8FXJ4_PATCE
MKKLKFWICLHNIFTLANYIFLGNPNNDHEDEDALMDIDDDIDSDYTTETQNRARGCRVRIRGCGVRIHGGAKQIRHIDPKQVSVPRGSGSRRGRGGGHGHKLHQWIWAETDKDDFVPRDPVFVGNEGLLIRTHSQTPHVFLRCI